MTNLERIQETKWIHLLVRVFALVLVIAGVLAIAALNFTGGPAYNDRPILWLNSYQHNSAITRAGLSADGQTLVTAARDNTIKVWHVADMTLINTLRVPISADYQTNPGSAFLWAVDISPDGKIVAAAGQIDRDGDFRIFLFDTASGELLRRTPLIARGFISDLAFSRDGTLLAAGLYNEAGDPNNGLWVWDTRDWSRPIFRDRRYGESEDQGGRINGIKFNQDGVLITTSFDRHLRRYADVRAQTPPRVVATPPRIVPYDIDFSPDGQSVVVGFQNRQEENEPAAVKLFRSDTLEQIGDDLDVSGLDDGQGGRVAATVVRGVGFSRSGRYVYANIIQHAVGLTDERVRRYSVQDLSVHEDYENCTDQTVMQIVPYQQDGALLINSDPCIYAIGDDGQVQPARVRIDRYPIYYDDLDNEYLHGELRVSRRGDKFYLKGEQEGAGLLFDLTTRQIVHDPVLSDEDRQELQGATEQVGSIHLTDWGNSAVPKFNGEPICIRTQDANGCRDEEHHAIRSSLARNISFSVDVADSGAFAVLGDVFDLARYSAPGQRDWRILVPALVMRTNITQDENVVVTYSIDGVMRWHDARDGYIILSLFMDAAGERWVMWTPAGYYDGSAGADDLIGWHLNHGRNRTPSFEAASRYADTFRRPDIITAVVRAMAHGDDADARGVLAMSRSPDLAEETVRAHAPPITRIDTAHLSQTPTGPSLRVSFSVSSPSGKRITGYEVDVDGRSLGIQHADAPPGETFLSNVALYRGASFVRVRASTADGWGHAVNVSVADAYRRAEIDAAQGRGMLILRSAAPAAPIPNLHSLIIGVNYRQGPPGPLHSLCCAVADAQAVEGFVRAQEHTRLFNRVEPPVTLYEANATLVNLRRELRRLTNVNRNDVVLVFIAGHGVPDTRGNYYFIPYGVQPDASTIDQQALIGREITDVLRHTRARVMLFMDTCSSQGAIERSFLSQVAGLEKTVYTFTSSQDGQPSWEDPEFGHGTFTRALLEAAYGADRPIALDGVITFDELGPFLRRRVEAFTARRSSLQVPTYLSGGQGGLNQNADLFQVARARN